MSDKNKSEKHHECATVTSGQLAKTCKECLAIEYDSRVHACPAVHQHTCDVFLGLRCNCDPLRFPSGFLPPPDPAIN